MRLSDDFVVHEMGDEQILVPTGSASFSGMIRNNRTAAFIVNQLREGASEEEIISRMTSTFDVRKDTAAADVRKILDGLRSVGALVE